MIPPKRTSQPSPPANQQSKNKVLFGSPTNSRGHRVCLYGTGGIGKTTLACLLPGVSAFVDADESVGILAGQLNEQGITPPLIIPAHDWSSLRNALRADGWDKVDNIVIDTATKIEEWAVADTVKEVKHEKGYAVKSIEDYGFGKGFQFTFDTFLPLLSDLDRHVRAGRNVVLIAHECTSTVPNPMGEDFLRYEPRLQSPSSGKASIRYRIKEWADHVLFLAYDINVDKPAEGKPRKALKAQGSGTRTLYTAELPFCMAKSRTTNEQFDIELGSSPWDSIIK